jgi:TolB-like protein/DNA-binding winged helix-turn-helix (wHTH) protein/Tfp pilus assembly protein PilF
MSIVPVSSPPLRFGPYELNVTTGELRKWGLRIKLRPQAAKVLIFLATRVGQVVTRKQLQEEVWGSGIFVDFEHGLNLCIRQIRAVLDDDADKPRYIETVTRQGYRFIARIEEPSPGVPQVSLVGVPVSNDSATGKTIGAAPTNQNFKGHLGWMVWTAIALGAVISVVAFVMPKLGSKLSTSNSVSAIQSVAVLPLENLSRDPDQEYFADGMTDELITDLAQIHSVRVISRNSVMPYKRKPKSAVQIGSELQVDAIIEGTVMRSGSEVRVTAQLIDAHSDRHLWAHTYERSMNDVLMLQDDIASAIANQIKVTLDPAEAIRLANAPTIDSEAYDSYLEGRYFWNKRDPDGLQRALGYFQQAVRKDPSYAPAEAGLADTYALLGSSGFDVLPGQEATEKARAAAEKALSLDDGLAEAHASLGFVLFTFDWDLAHAEREFKRAIALNPSYASAHHWYSELLSNLGRSNEAMVEAQIALRLDPLSLIVNENVARIHYFARDFDRAIEGSRKTLEMDPNFSIAHLRLGRAFAAKGMYKEAVQEFERFSQLSGDSTLAIASIGNALARSGNRSEAMHSLMQLRALSKQRRVPSICFVLLYLGLGDKDQAIDWLEKSCRERSTFLTVAKVDPLFDSLREDPRFQDLLRRIGFS